MLTISTLGGCLMPTLIMLAFQDMLVRGYGVAGILPESLILLAFAAVFFAIGVWRFRFD